MSAPAPHLAPDACSLRSADLGESAYGSAADAAFWLCIEQGGPYGRAAATESHLDPDLGRRLDAAVAAAGGRFALVRRPGAHADDHRLGAPRRVLVAGGAGVGWLLSGEVDHPSDLEALDVAALARGDLAAVLRSLPAVAPDPAPTLLLCTNGRRDVCCAVRGRPIAVGAATARPGRVWETSHTGGHRFAPTGVLLPSGATLARLDVPLAVLALDGAADGRLPAALHGPVHDRGDSSLDAPRRAAVSTVRQEVGEESLDALDAGPAEVLDERTWRVVVRRADASWTATVTRGVLGPDRRESCLKPAVAQVGWSVTL